jgi:hypothetical protein
MDRIIGFIIFLSIFLSVYAAMHVYVFFRLSTFLNITRNIWFYIVIIALALSYPEVSAVERSIGGRILGVTYGVVAAWVGVIFFALAAVAAYDLLRLFFKFNDKIGGLVVILAVLLIVAYSIINAMLLNVKTIEVPVANLESPLKVVQLSDIHLGTIHNGEYLARIVEKVNSLSPDMVLITGDFVDGSGIITAQSVSPLNNLKAKTFFTTGNHEIYEGIDYVTKLFKTTKVEMLRNSVSQHKGVQIIGMDYPSNEFTTQKLSLDGIKINSSMPSILMYHPPVGLDVAAAHGISLQLSGHTHRGQIMPFNLLTRLFYKYTYGLYNKDGTYLYVSPGTGTWGPPMRLGSRNEITLINLVRAE